MLLLVPGNKTDDDYRRWSAEIGKSSNLGVQIQVAIRYSDRPGPHVVATGVVGVPRPPEDDMERQILACKLADLVETPDIAIFALTGYLRWRLVRGGPFEVELTECRQVRELDESEISDRISLSGPGPMSEPVFRAKPAESAHWEREYRANRYLRFESRAALNQRYQDLLTNIKILTDKGKVTLTDQNRWHRLFRHVVEEMLIRGEPPVPHNFDPHIAPAVLFSDQDFCARAADAVANVTIAGPCLVKYGQKEHMRDLYHRGEVHMCTASHYRDPDYNQAVHDQELIIMQCGVVSSKSGYMKSHDVSADPDLLDELGPRFLPLYRASDAARDELVWGLARAPDAWIYCMSDSLAPRLFSDFHADACVVLDRSAFEVRMSDALRELAHQTLFAHGNLCYVDPLGAYTEPPPVPTVYYCHSDSRSRGAQPFRPFGPGGQLLRPPFVHFDKLFRFAYQREYRFVSYPAHPTERLTAPLHFTLGSLHDIAQLIVL